MDTTPDCSMMDIDENEDVLTQQLPATQVGLVWQASQVPALRAMAATAERHAASRKKLRVGPTTPFQDLFPVASTSNPPPPATYRVPSTRPSRRSTPSLSSFQAESTVIDKDVLKSIASQVNERTRRRNKELGGYQPKKSQRSRNAMPPPPLPASAQFSSPEYSSHSSGSSSSSPFTSPASDVSMAEINPESSFAISQDSFARGCEFSSTPRSLSQTMMPPPPTIPILKSARAPTSIKTMGEAEKRAPKSSPYNPNVKLEQRPTVLSPKSESEAPRMRHGSAKHLSTGASMPPPPVKPTAPNSQTTATARSGSGPPALGMRRVQTAPVTVKTSFSQQKVFRPPLLPSQAEKDDDSMYEEGNETSSSPDKEDSSFDFGESFDDIDPDALEEALAKVAEDERARRESKKKAARS